MAWTIRRLIGMRGQEDSLTACRIAMSAEVLADAGQKYLDWWFIGMPPGTCFTRN
jgi:hypothetical protein